MKFEVGDKVVVREDLETGKTYGAAIFVDEMKVYRGKAYKVIEADTYDGIYALNCSENWNFTDEMLMPFHFTKSDLQDGMVVECRNGNRRINIGGNLLSGNGIEYNQLSDYKEDLLDETDYENFDIVKIYKPKKTFLGSLEELFKDKKLEMIWKRVEEQESETPPAPALKMTVAEIESALGHPVEIVATKEEKSC